MRIARRPPACHHLRANQNLAQLRSNKEFTMADQPFLTDIKTIRERARQHIEKGAVTESYQADRGKVIDLLNEALATEIVCTLRYRRHYYTVKGIHAKSVAAE